MVVGKLETSYKSNDPGGFWEKPCYITNGFPASVGKNGAKCTCIFYDAFAPDLYLWEFLSSRISISTEIQC